MEPLESNPESNPLNRTHTQKESSVGQSDKDDDGSSARDRQTGGSTDYSTADNAKVDWALQREKEISFILHHRAALSIATVVTSVVHGEFIHQCRRRRN